MYGITNRNILRALVICLLGIGLALSGDRQELVIAKPFGPAVVLPDPASGYNGWYTQEAGITETLFRLDLNLCLQPWLAESYRQVSPRVWEIVLRPGVRFHDGRLLDAAAVRESFRRFLDPSSPRFNKRLQGLLDIRRLEVTGERTVRIETNRPNAAFLFNLTAPGTAVVSPASDGENLYGTGPFRLQGVIPNEELMVTRFEGYWGGRPRLQQVRLKVIKNPVTRMLVFEAGEVDVAIGFPETDLARLQGRPGVRIYHAPTNRLCFFFLRVADGPLQDGRIRQALNYAVNRSQIVKLVLAGVGGRVAAGLFPEILPWRNPHLVPYPYDPARARRLLEEAGACDTDGDGVREWRGQPLVLNAWTYEGRAALKPVLELVQAQLREVGIALRLRVTKRGSPINQAMRRGEVQMSLQMWNVAPQGDPDYFISNVFTSTAPFNFMGYANAELDSLARRGKVTFDPQQRKRIYNRIQEIIYRDSPVLVLFHKAQVTVTYDYVENYHIHPAENYLLTPYLGRK